MMLFPLAVKIIALANLSNIMNLHLMEDFAESHGAVCLDGSPGGFYFRAATSRASTAKWLLHFKGAGWCFDELDCYGRSEMEFGSSKFWATSTAGWSGGMLSPNDPTFGSFNKVILMYCDGGSFTGNRTDPIDVAGPGGKPAKQLYFRGLRILNAIIATLVRDHGLDKSTEVLLTGCSSGGLAAYIHADRVAKLITTAAPQLAKFMSVPVSGFFLEHTNVNGVAVYPNQMKEVVTMGNSIGGLNSDCVAAASQGDEWQCIFAQHSLTYSSIPTFVLNSGLDMWQEWCIFTAEPVSGFPSQKGFSNGNCSAVPGWKACSKNPENCTSTQTAVLNVILSEFVDVVAAAVGAHDGNGAFITSCHEHCDGIAGGWRGFLINGVNAQEAVTRWWNASPTRTSPFFRPCTPNVSSPHTCNPTCPKQANK